MQTGIAGSASREGSTQVYGIMDGTNNAVVKRAMLIWGIAVSLLVVFHVGGSKL